MTRDDSTTPSLNPEGLSAPARPDRRGVARVAAVLLVLAGTFGLTYLVPALGEYRPWLPEDPAPLASLLDLERAPQASPLIFEQKNRAWGLGMPDEELATAMSDAELLARAPVPEAPSLPPTPAVAVSPPRPQAPPPEPLRLPAPVGASPPAEPEPASSSWLALRPAPRTWVGMTREIELLGDSGALEHFHEALSAVAREEEGAKARIVVYSTSTNGSDRVTQQLRRVLGAHFGDGGKGWVPIAPAWKWQRHQDVVWRRNGWTTHDVTRRNGAGGRYGYGGVEASGYRGASASFGTVSSGPTNRVASRFALFYQARPRGGALLLAIDDGEPVRIETRAERVEDRRYELRAEPGPHTLKVKVERGLARLYGVTLENDSPGVVVDAVMLIGAFVNRLNNFDTEHIAEQIRQRSPDLLVFYMGANDAAAGSVAWRPERFVRLYVQAIERIHAGRPEASCLVMSILDQGMRRRGRIVTRPRVPKVVAAQQRVARKAGCAFFDLFQAMGGEGSMGRWYAATPRLVTSDYGHPTVAGARVVGLLLGRAMFRAWDDWLARRAGVGEAGER